MDKPVTKPKRKLCAPNTVVPPPTFCMFIRRMLYVMYKQTTKTQPTALHMKIAAIAILLGWGALCRPPSPFFRISFKPKFAHL